MEWDWGYNQNKKQGKIIILIGLLCDHEGVRISVKIFKGNTEDIKMFAEQIKKASQEFGCRQVAMVGDRGMIKIWQIKDKNLALVVFHHITAITNPQNKSMIANAGQKMGQNGRLRNVPDHVLVAPRRGSLC